MAVLEEEADTKFFANCFHGEGQRYEPRHFPSYEGKRN
eukprot:CAMPEP_0117540896 /NCGR_PEP_ID=MMETSP0784-20121206/43735_1 /TAXON_ID=39447 /ORGANISM="" /LENGTH=37 /DNA_ID= /DNA_START= /DNA_END= /DNA_ORIENTATION=